MRRVTLWSLEMYIFITGAYLSKTIEDFPAQQIIPNTTDKFNSVVQISLVDVLCVSSIL